LRLAGLLVAVLVVGFAAGVLGYAAGPDAHNLDATVQLAAIGAVAAAIGVIGVIVASAINADAANAVAVVTERIAENDRGRAGDDAKEDRQQAAADAREDRQQAATDARQARADARAARIHERKVALFAEVLQGTDVHAREIAQQVRSRQEMSDRAGDPDTIPNVGSTDPVGLAAGSLYAFADQRTADAAWDVYLMLTTLDGAAYIASKHRVGNEVAGLEPEEWDAFWANYKALTGLKTRFIDLVRAELDLPTLVPAEPLPVAIPVAAPAVASRPQSTRTKPRPVKRKAAVEDPARPRPRKPPPTTNPTK
jgi:hypothetical protein